MPAPAAAPPAGRAAPPAPSPAAAPARAAPAPAAGSRPVNPFLSQDPALKARRLARALISDMVVYHPAKRQEGLRDGNLKELFDEEIRKSWEEYAEQVGQGRGRHHAVLQGSAERDPRRRSADLLSQSRVAVEPVAGGTLAGRAPVLARRSASLTDYLSALTTRGVSGMADLVERLTELQHRVTELRDFL